MNQDDSIPVVTLAYAYQGSLLCQDCGRAIVEKLRSNDVLDEGDSGTFPQGPYDDGGGEADSAHFCDLGTKCLNAVDIMGHKIGVPLGNPLTRDGIAALAESLRSDIAAPDKRTRLVGRVLRSVWASYAETDAAFGRIPPRHVGQIGEKLPHSLVEALKKYVRQTPEKAASVRGEVYSDADNVYLFASRGPQQRHGYHWGSAVDLLRAPAGDDGEFSEIQVVSIAPEAATDQPVEMTIRDAVSEGAWD